MIKRDNRNKSKLKVGVDIPAPDEIKRVVHAATGRMRPFLITVIFTGLRSSRVARPALGRFDLKNGELHVRQRADRYNEMGKPKSEAGERAIPLGPLVVNTLREWRLACPKGELGLVFPNAVGKIWNHAGIVSAMCGPPWSRRASSMPTARPNTPACIAAALLCLVAHQPEEGWRAGTAAKTVQASGSFINRRDDGHLRSPIPGNDDGSELAEAEKTLLA